MHSQEVHPRFKINGFGYSFEDLKEIGYSLVKEGEPFEKEIGDFLLDWVSDATQIVQRTSGSTGPPKLIEIQKSKMIASARATGEYFKLGAGTTALLCLPASTIAGKMMLVRAMVLGWSLYYVKPSLNPLKDLERNLNFLSLTPAQARNSLKTLPRVDLLIIGGAPVYPNLKKKLSAISSRIFETYGMTETITHIAVRPIQEGAVPPFEALPGVTFEVDERGCLIIHAPHLSERAVVTNDMVSLISEHSFQWLGRADHVINSGGLKLFPEQLETQLSGIIPNRFFLAGEKDEALGERLIMICEGEVDTDQLKEDLRNKIDLPKNKLPGKIYAIDVFPETRSGKVNRPKTLQLLKIKSAK